MKALKIVALASALALTVGVAAPANAASMMHHKKMMMHHKSKMMMHKGMMMKHKHMMRHHMMKKNMM